MEVSKEFSFELAHSLGFHNGQCSNLHGHSYKMIVTLRSQHLINGMVMDFTDIKDIVNRTIIQNYDHACVVNKNSQYEFDKELIELLKKHNKKLVLVDFYPTAEEMARHFYNMLDKELNQGIKVKEVILYETKSSCAKYGEEI